MLKAPVAEILNLVFTTTDDEIAKAALKHHLKEAIQFLTKFGRTLRNGDNQENKLNKQQCDMANTISSRLRNNRQLTAIEIGNAHKILDIVTEEAPELFFQLDELNERENKSGKQKSEITLDTIMEIVKWDRKNKRLKDYEYKFMADLAEGKKTLTDRNLFIAELNLKKVKKYGYK